jgi:hypothetical protein
MIPALLAQALGGYSIVQLAIIVIIIGAVIAIVLVALRAMGVAVPGWAMQIFWVVVIAVVAIFALVVLVRLVGSV